MGPPPHAKHFESRDAPHAISKAPSCIFTLLSFHPHCKRSCAVTQTSTPAPATTRFAYLKLCAHSHNVSILCTLPAAEELHELYLLVEMPRKVAWKSAGDMPHMQNADNTVNYSYSLMDREEFNGIYLNLSKSSGRCRFAPIGVGWKPQGGGGDQDMFTLEKEKFVNAYWSRAARGYEIKLFTRDDVHQFDGFEYEVRRRCGFDGDRNMTLTECRRLSG